METAAVNGYDGIEHTVLDIELLFVCVDSTESESRNGESQIYIFLFGQRICFIKLNLSTYTPKIREIMENSVPPKQPNAAVADAAAFFPPNEGE